ncbi:MAG: radical SAM/SPASM domain-containing protein [Chloroflexota bacterium]|nr:radical SAM/SPASM domain-containing protein [Chloroflexota bacterium]
MAFRHLLNLASDHLTSLPILILYLTDGCNSRCVTCDIWRNPRLNMRRELVEQLVSEVKPLGIRWVVLSGGEAMQHPHWAQIARRFREAGARLILLTNGLFLRKQADDVIASVDEVVVSLDGGTAATYEAIRGVDAFGLVLEGMAAVHAGGIPITTRTTLQRANFAEMPQIIDAAKSVGVDHVSFLTVDVSNPYAFGDREIPISSIVGATALPTELHQAIAPEALTPEDCDRLEQIIATLERTHAAEFTSGQIAESPDKLRRMLTYFRALLGNGDFPPVRCNAPHTSAVVQVDGTLRPCYFLPTMGTVGASNPSMRTGQRGGAEYSLPLRDAINSDAALGLRHAYRAGERAECGRCVCPLYKGTRALIQL